MFRVHSRLKALVRGLAFCALLLVCPALSLAAQDASPQSQRKQLPDVTFFDEAGQRVSLAQYHGKVVVLNFWARWCGHCRNELSSLASLEKKMHKAGLPFQLLCVNVDSDNSGLAYLKDKKLAVSFYHDRESAALRALGSSWLPTTLIVDPAGSLVQVIYGEVDWEHDQNIETLLHSLAKEADRKGA